MLYRLTVIMFHTVLQEIKERNALAFRAGVDHSVIDTDDRAGDGTSGLERHAQIRAGQLRDNLFKRSEEEHLVLHDGPADRSAELIAAEILKRFSIRCVCRQAFRAEILK